MPESVSVIKKKMKAAARKLKPEVLGNKERKALNGAVEKIESLRKKLKKNKAKTKGKNGPMKNLDSADVFKGFEKDIDKNIRKIIKAQNSADENIESVQKNVNEHFNELIDDINKMEKKASKELSIRKFSG